MSSLHIAGSITIVLDGPEHHGAEIAERLRFELDRAPTLLAAVRRVLGGIHVPYAIACASSDLPEEVVVAKSGMPIVIAETPAGDLVLARGIADVGGRVRDVVYLDDGELAVVRPGDVVIRRIDDGRVVVRARPGLESRLPLAA